MSSNNGILKLLASNSVSNNTPIGLDRNFVNSRNSARIDENETQNGFLLGPLLYIHSGFWYLPQFERDDIDLVD